MTKESELRCLKRDIVRLRTFDNSRLSLLLRSAGCPVLDGLATYSGVERFHYLVRYTGLTARR